MLEPSQNITTFMVQYGLFPNCTGSCDFCLLKERVYYSHEEVLNSVRRVRKNLDFIDWKGKFANGISLLGGEIYGYKNKEYEIEFMLLIDDIIKKVLKVSPTSKYSTVTNGMYEPSFLYQVCDRIIGETSIKALDINFSYDIKYRFKTDNQRKLVLSNIRSFRDKYNYTVGVQMILTQYVIDSILNGSFDFQRFMKKDIEGCSLSFLYPHPINTGKVLSDFYFSRKPFLDFLLYLESHYPEVFLNTTFSSYHSGVYKYSGLFDRTGPDNQQAILAEGKERLMGCGHSELYRCYSDTDKCMLCDIINITSFFGG